MNTQQDLSYIIYTSKATTEFDGEMLDQILTVSREWNQAHGITGILLYHNSNVMQVLEGSKRDISNIFEKISIDQRHENVHQIAFRETEHRSFSEWSMAFSEANQALFDSVNSGLSDNPFKGQITYTKDANEAILSLVKTFVAINP